MFQNSNRVFETVQSRFSNLRVLVIGDLMLDRYLWGTVERISPEAPVPVIRLDHKSQAPGGAANVAANLRGLNCAVGLFGVVGVDDEGRQLLDLLKSGAVETSTILSVPARPTICKTRILGGRQQMLRLDVEEASEFNQDLQRQLLARIEPQIPACAAIILSDYGKGVLADFLCQNIIRRAREVSVPVLVDPKGSCYQKYAGCNLISPNRLELSTATNTEYSQLQTLFQKGQLLRADLSIDHLTVTLGELGIALLNRSGIRRFPALAREVFDVSGAGDTVIATMAAAIAAGLPLDDAIELANLAAGVVIGKVGTVPISGAELLAVLRPDAATEQDGKICSFEQLLRQVAHWRSAGQRVVFTNGCFDLFHIGHLALLEQAKREGDSLVVALNTDRSVRSLKGPSRPIISQDARAKLVAALPFVDAVVLFDEETPLNLIRAVRPEVLVKGGDYSEEQVVGAREMKEWGGRVSLIPVIEGFSTTTILKRAVASLREETQKFLQ